MAATPEDRLRIEKGLNRAAFSAHLSDLFSHLGIDCVLDVGAHRGEYARLLRGTGYAGVIVSFEPVRESFAELVDQSGPDALWHARQLALGNEEGQAEINVTRSADFSSFSLPSVYGVDEFPEMIETERREAVTVRRLDAVFDECIADLSDPNVFLKLDVQGSEPAVLEGAGECLRAVAAVQIEAAVKPIYEDVQGYVELISRLNELGYELTGLFPVTRDRKLRIVEIDCVMARAAEPPGHHSVR